MQEKRRGQQALFLGFKRLEHLVENGAKSRSDGYPPFDVMKVGEDGFRVTLAVSGFAIKDLSISVENSQLVVRGRQQDSAPETAAGRHFLHRGIAARQFQKRFELANNVEVTRALLKNGLLHIDLQRVPPENRIRKIPIKKK